jgi:hypothetical protein
MKRLAAAVCIIAIIASVASAVSFPVTGSNLTGDRTSATSAGLVGHGSWTTGGADGGIEIKWNISQITSGTLTGDWNYSYTFTELNGNSLKTNVTHLLLQVSSSSSNIFSNANCQITAPQNWTSSNFSTLPTSIYAVELSGESPINTFSFTSTDSPTWGSFYADCSSYVWNSGIGSYPTSGSGSFTNWIPVPGATATCGSSTVVPEPATMALLGLGIASLIARRKIARA